MHDDFSKARQWKALCWFCVLKKNLTFLLKTKTLVTRLYRHDFGIVEEGGNVL